MYVSICMYLSIFLLLFYKSLCMKYNYMRHLVQNNVKTISFIWLLLDKARKNCVFMMTTNMAKHPQSSSINVSIIIITISPTVVLSVQLQSCTAPAQTEQK